MHRPICHFASLIAACLPYVALAQPLGSEIVPSDVAQRYGLKRTWVAQGQVHRGVDRMVGLALDADGLCLLSARGILELLDAETGTARWAIQIGNPDHPASGPGLDSKHVAICKGSMVYVIDRATGKQVFEKRVQHAASSAPAVWDKFVYVPLFNGMLSTFDLSRPRSAPWYYRSAGHLDIPPLATAKTLAWATSRGYVYASDSDKLNVRFQFRAAAQISAPLAHAAPYLFISSRDGFVYAINEMNGHLLWRFAAGDSVDHEPVVIGDQVFVVPESGGMYCLSKQTGLQRWFAAGISQFVAASPNRQAPRRDKRMRGVQLTRIYAADPQGDLVILDAGGGARLDVMPASRLPWKFTNAQNDRIYLATPGGLIQCLHESGLEQPTDYRHTAPTPQGDDEKPPAAAEGGATTPADGQPAADQTEENPFDEAEAKP